MSQKLFLAFVALFVSAAASVASAQQGLIDATRPERILSVAKGFGGAELSKDTKGDPVIKGRIESVQYYIYFYGCKDGKNCRSVLLKASNSVTNKPALVAMNEFNQKSRFAKAYLDADADPVVELDINLDGGVSSKNLDDTFDWWKNALKQYRETFLN
jgi:hypothetical protein